MLPCYRLQDKVFDAAPEGVRKVSAGAWCMFVSQPMQRPMRGVMMGPPLLRVGPGPASTRSCHVPRVPHVSAACAGCAHCECPISPMQVPHVRAPCAPCKGLMSRCAVHHLHQHCGDLCDH